ncbi:MAG: hypothetical protein ABR609_13775, partial [Acidimicrobiia bacterium]
MSADEMSASPDPDGTYGPLDDLLAEVARTHKNRSWVKQSLTQLRWRPSDHSVALMIFWISSIPNAGIVRVRTFPSDP